MRKRFFVICSLGLIAGINLRISGGAAADNSPLTTPDNANNNSQPQANKPASPEKTDQKDTFLTLDSAQQKLDQKISEWHIPPAGSERLHEMLNSALAHGKTIDQKYLDTFLDKEVVNFSDMFGTVRKSGGQLSDKDMARLTADAQVIVANLSNEDLGPLDFPLDKALIALTNDKEIDSADKAKLVNDIVDGVIRNVQKHIHDNPDDAAGNSVGYEVLGSIHTQKGQWGDALKDYDESVHLDSGNQDALQGRSEVRYKLGDYLGADRDARALLQLDPDNPAAIAMLKLTEGRTEPSRTSTAGTPIQTQANSAMAGYTAGKSSQSSDSVVSRNLGQNQSAQYAKQAASALALKDAAGAVRQATLAIASNPNNAQAYNYRAMALMKSGQYQAALEDVNQALRLIPGDPVATVTKSYALNRLGRYRESIALLEDAGLGAGSKNADASYNLAYAEAGLGDRRAMLNALSRAAHLDAGRFGRVYQMAIQLPQGADLAYLFDGENAAAGALAIAQGTAKANSDRKFFFTVLIALAGGLLMALGFLHILMPGWSRTATRRVAEAVIGKNESPEVVISGTFKIVRQIGSGGMGTVYEAFDLNLQRPVALKKMRAEIREDLRERQRFLKEARTVAGLRHPNIVEIYAIVEEASEISLVFEYVEGRTLHQMLAEKGHFGFSEVRKILKDVCEALQYAHAHRVIHRDLKPSNIMIARSGAVKVMDFGIARQVKDVVSRLMTNTIAGTPPYMAPEVEQGMVGGEADVYSLGVCLYELLAGDVPFTGIGAGMLLNKMNMNFKPLSSSVPGLPPGIDELMARALQPEPAKRIRTPAEFLAAMESLAAG